MAFGSTALTAALAVVAAAAPSGRAAVALGWLSAVDQGRYADSWAQAGEMFRSRVSSDGWVARIRPVRTPLGPVVSRRLIKEENTRSLPGAPDGRYDILQFATDFAHKHAAVETVVLAED